MATTDKNVQEGFGGDSQWEALKKYGLSDTDSIGKLDAKTSARDAELQGYVDSSLGAAQASIDKMTEANASALKGEIPADVTAAVRRAASENSIMRGIGGQASRALSARDLGVTSSDIQRKALETESVIGAANRNLATVREGMRQSELTRSAQLDELRLKSKSSNLAAIDLERQRISTNIQANVQILGYIERLVEAQQQLAVQASSNDIDPSGLMATFDGWLSQFSGKLNG